MTPSPFFAHPSANKIEYSRVIRLVSRVLCSGKLFLANSMLAAQWGDYLVAKLMYYSPLAKCLQSLANHRVIWSSPLLPNTMFVQLDMLASFLLCSFSVTNIGQARDSCNEWAVTLTPRVTYTIQQMSFVEHSVWNYRKSIIQHDERSELRLHLEWTKVH